MNERPAWIHTDADDGKKHDNPHHAGMRSHQARIATADESLAEVLDSKVKLGAQALSAILRIRHERESKMNEL